MAIMQALALLAGAGTGTIRRKQDDREEERRRQDDAWREEQRQRQRVDWSRQDEQYGKQQAEEQAVKQAAMPTSVEDAPVAMPIGSRDEPRAPEDVGIRAAGKTFTNRADADKAAGEYNAAPARMRRAAAAVSDPVRAGQIEASAQTAETGAMQLRAAKLKEADDAFNRDLMNSVTDFASLESFVNASKGDGQGGALKIKVVPNPDGKTVAVMKVGADGKVTSTPFSFPNSIEGVQQAAGVIGMRLPPEQKLAHLHAAAKTDEERRRWNMEYDLKKTDSENRGKREDRMATAAERTAAAAEAKNAPGTLSLADIQGGHKTIATTLNADYKAQLEDLTLTPENAAAIKKTRELEIADAQRLYTGAMMHGIAMTPEQAIMAFRTGKRTTAEVPDTAGNKHTVEVMVVNGRLIPFAEAPGKAQPKPAAPPAKPAPTPTKAGAEPKRAGGAGGSF